MQTKERLRSVPGGRTYLCRHRSTRTIAEHQSTPACMYMWTWKQSCTASAATPDFARWPTIGYHHMLMLTLAVRSSGFTNHGSFFGALSSRILCTRIHKRLMISDIAIGVDELHQARGHADPPWTRQNAPMQESLHRYNVICVEYSRLPLRSRSCSCETNCYCT